MGVGPSHRPSSSRWDGQHRDKLSVVYHLIIWAHGIPVIMMFLRGSRAPPRALYRVWRRGAEPPGKYLFYRAGVFEGKETSPRVSRGGPGPARSQWVPTPGVWTFMGPTTALSWCRRLTRLAAPALLNRAWARGYRDPRSHYADGVIWGMLATLNHCPDLLSPGNDLCWTLPIF